MTSPLQQKLKVTGPVVVTANRRSAAFRIAGTLPAAPAGQAIGTVDIAAAQWRFGRLGRVDRLDDAELPRLDLARHRASARAERDGLAAAELLDVRRRPPHAL